MDTGDPTNLFSNLLVLYAMYYLSYNDYSKQLKKGFIKITRGSIMAIGFICFIGWLDIITITEVKDQYFIAFSNSMKLTDKPLLNVHVFFLFLAFKIALISGFEWILGANDKVLKDNQNTKRKGA